MNRPSVSEAAAPAAALSRAPSRVSLAEIFAVFLTIGATSIGGGVVAYLRRGLVAKRGWLDDATFVQMLSISEALPGLNGTNIAILAGDHLRGGYGAIAAITGICLPGALIMFAVGVAYTAHGDHPLTTAILATVAAAAVGLVFSVTAQLGRSMLNRVSDLVFVGLTAILVHFLHLSVLLALLVVGALAIWWHRPRPDGTNSAGS
jgi:chromate transporter